MPIYAYKCDSCGHTKDVLQKMSDTPLSVCPQCSAETFKKQLTAAGFQLKGSGWYVTDFRGGSSGKPGETAEKSADVSPGGGVAADAAKPGVPGSVAAPSSAPASPPAAAASAAPPSKAQS